MKTSIYRTKTTIEDYSEKIEEIKTHIGNCLEGKTNEEKVLITVTSLNNSGTVTTEQILVDQRKKTINHGILSLHHKAVMLANEVFDAIAEEATCSCLVDEETLTVWVGHPEHEQTYTYELDEE